MKTCQNCKYKELRGEEHPCEDCEYISDYEMSHWEPIPPEYTPAPEYNPADVAFSKVADSGERKEFPSGAKRDIQEGKGMKGFIEIHTKGGKRHLINIRHIVEVSGCEVYTDDIAPFATDFPYFSCLESYEEILAKIEGATS